MSISASIALFLVGGVIGFAIGRGTRKTKYVEKKSGRGHQSEGSRESHNDRVKPA
jgi:hypothetical protein